MNNNTIDNSIKIPVLQEGDKLFHYTTAEGAKGICEGEFWITENGFLNDKTELTVASGIFEQIIREKISNNNIAEYVRKEVYKEIEDFQRMGGINDSIAYGCDYIISFSQEYDSALMWSEFSDFYGYCLTFDFKKLSDSFDSKLLLHGKVIYDLQEQKRLMLDTIKKEIFDAKSFPDLNSWDDFSISSDKILKTCYVHLAAIVSVYNYFYKLDCFSGKRNIALYLCVVMMVDILRKKNWKNSISELRMA